MTLSNLSVNTVHHGDCVQLLPGLENRSVDLVATDPPYLRNYTPRDGRTIVGDKDDAWLVPAFAEIYRVLKPNTFCVTFYGWPVVDRFMTAWKKVGFSPVSHLVCVKEYSSRRGYTRSFHETVFLLAKGRPEHPLHPPDDVLHWRYTGNPLHPNQKPVVVMQKLIVPFSRPGDLILDPFAGSGTTAIAAGNCRRDFILIEKMDRYFQVARERLIKNQSRREGA